MSKRLRVIAIVIAVLAIFTGTVSAYSEEAKKITLNENGVETPYTTHATTVFEFISEQEITLGNNDIMDKSMDYELKDMDTIVIERAASVIINIDGVPRMYQTTDDTVGEFLDSVKDKINITYIMENVTEDTEISNNLVINLVSTQEKIYTVTEEIPYEIVKRENNSLEMGLEQVAQEGSNGIVEIVVKDVYAGDVIVSSEELSKVITTEAVNAIVEVGTKEKLVTAVGNFDYSYALNVTATAYTPYDPGCTGTTATGTVAQYGVIAVDPKVIPMGTKIYIPGYGVAVAEDTGGAIKGNKIDLCYETVQEAYGWGVKNITIYVLE